MQICVGKYRTKKLIVFYFGKYSFIYLSTLFDTCVRIYCVSVNGCANICRGIIHVIFICCRKTNHFYMNRYVCRIELDMLISC